MRFTRNVGIILLSIYLILIGITALFGVAVPTIVLGLLALIGGIFLLIGI